MLNLFDYLTPLDNKRIENYISLYGIEDSYVGNETYLREWAKEKKHLFHLLGGNLIYKFPFEFEKIEREIDWDIVTLMKHPFGKKFQREIERVLNTDESTIEQAKVACNLKQLYTHSAFKNDKTDSTIKYRKSPDAKLLQIPSGMKPIRAIQKIIDYLDFDDETKTLFEDFRCQHSLIYNDKTMKGNMCLSIHPLDFMTMSDNDSDWQSCMNWRYNGCYRLGTVEMMNSNNVICCYIESTSKDFVFGGDGSDEWTWNNKKWRQLFYITKEIAVSGKAYPYQNEVFSKIILDKIKELTEKNLGRTYTFGIEEYRDMKHVGSLYRMERNHHWAKGNNGNKHNIIFDTQAMYNDMFNDTNTTYWCYRNKVKKNLVISYSGKTPCLCCGKDTVKNDTYPDYYYEGDYNERYAYNHKLICWSCAEDRECECCHDDSGAKKIYNIQGHKYCKKCLDDQIRKCPDCGEPFRIPPTWNALGWIRLTPGEVYQQDFYDEYCDSESRVVAPYCTCGRCNGIDKFKEAASFVRPAIDKARTAYSWRSKNEYWLTNNIFDKTSKYLAENLEKFEVE